MVDRVIACTACHGREGRATQQGYFPRIAGKPAGYLYHQLLNFRDGRRSYPQMSYLLEHMTDGYLREIAQHFSALELPYAAPPPPQALPATLERGRRLVREGEEFPAPARNSRSRGGREPAEPMLPASVDGPGADRSRSKARKDDARPARSQDAQPAPRKAAAKGSGRRSGAAKRGKSRR
ncbi:c-type cytochrome [Paracidovorax cattleyae]|uniref:c-type cytochrome n=1 Tax=Paracidovorax cattleyae TaxID=80868 RepID=UPI003EC14EA8